MRLRFVLALSFGLSASSAYAQAPDPLVAKFSQAQALYEQGKFDDALLLFDEVAESGSPNARLYAARCHRDLGQLPEAWEMMSLALREATKRAETEERYAATRDATAAELALLTPKVALLTVAIADPPPGTTVRVGARTLALARLDSPIAIAPGSIQLRVEAPSHEPSIKAIDATAGSAQTIAIVLKKASDPAVPLPKFEADDGPSTGLIVGGIALGAVGLGGFVTLGVAGSLANDKFDEVSSACGGKRCTDPRFAEDIDDGRTLDTVANVGIAVGVIGVVGGATMIVLGRPWASQAVVDVGPAGASFGWRGRF